MKNHSRLIALMLAAVMVLGLFPVSAGAAQTPGTPADVDFTRSASASLFQIVNQQSASISEGSGLTLVTTKDAFEPANGQLSGTAATTPKDLVLVPVSGDWTATLEFTFSTNGAANGYYQFFGFYAMADYNNAAGIRGGDGGMQDFLRSGGSITSETKTSSPGFSANGNYWYRIKKSGTTYECYRSSNGTDFTRMFSYENTGIQAQNLAIDAYTGMTTGYAFTLKRLTFEGVGSAPGGSDPVPGGERTDGYVAASGIEVGKTYVIVANNSFALNNHSANYNNQTTLGATAVTVSGDQITSEVTRDMLWTFRAAEGVSASVDGRAQYFVYDQDGVQLARKSGSSGTAPLSIGAPSKDNYGTWSVAERNAAANEFTFYVNSSSSSDYPFTLNGSAQGFNAPGKSRSEWDPATYGASVKFYELVSTEESGCDHSYSAAVTPATCTEGGYTIYTCALCGDSYTADETAALGHSYENGTCVRCGEAQPENPNGIYDIVFMSDLHNGVGGYPGFKQMVSELKNEGVEPSSISHGGDYVEDDKGGQPNWQTQVYDVISGTERSAFPNAFQAYTMGNHDWESGTFGGNANKEAAFKAMFGFDRAGLAYACDEYEIYMIGAQGTTGSGGGGESFIDSDINAFDSYLASKVGSGKVIFLQTHWPAHSSYNFKQRVVTNSDKMIDTINKYGDDLDVVWIWGHNHYEDNMRYEILQAGDQILYKADTSGSTWGNPRNPKYKTIKFTYANAGCMNDMWYLHNGRNNTSSSDNFRGPSACLSVAVEQGRITFTYNRIKKENNVWTFSHDADIEIQNHNVTLQHPSTVVVERVAGTPVCSHSYQAVTTEATCTQAGSTVYTCALCGDSYTEEIPALGHDYASIVTAPTCTAGGYTTFTCARCGDNYTANAVPALGHSYHSAVTAPTCVAAGYTTYTCNRCDYSYVGDPIPALGHSYQGVVTVPTCLSDGYTTYTCAHCGDSYIADEVPAPGHDYEIVVTAPTCLQDGYTTYSCKNCDFCYTADDVPALGHDYVGVVKEPTCTAGGYTTYTCARCGDRYTGNAVPALGHDYQAVVTAPTCTEEGYTTYTCTRCANSYEADIVPALGHDYNVEIFPATCEADGAKVYTCTACGDAYSVVIDALGHDYQAVITAPTCTEAGYTTYTCTRCDDSYAADIVPALGHDYDVEIIPATCEADGVKVYTCAACGDTYSEVIDALGHDYEAVVTAPTCIEEGYTTYTCTRCDASYDADETPATGHDYDVEIIPATCEADGEKVYTCSACGDTYSVAIPALGHDYKAVIAAPTCIAEGCTTYACTRCSDSYVDDVVPALGHDYVGIVKEPTCIAGGYTTYTCARCADRYTGNAVPALGHDYQAVVTAPTCTEAGNTTYTCTRCADSYAADIVPALGHDYDVEIIPASCEADGVKVFTCAACGDTYSEVIDALGHDYEAVVTAPTCIEEGYTTYTCTRCEASYAADETPATGHDYDVEISPATCEANGVKVYTCTACGDTYSEVIDALGHDYEAVITAPTCTEEGYTTYNCTRCDASYVADETPATGHDYEVMEIPATCEEAGTRTYTCKHCGDTYSEMIGATGHEFDNEVTAPTCTADGFTNHICRYCGMSYTDHVVPALGHDYVGIAKEPTCTAGGYTTYTCARCADRYTGNAVPALGHDYQAVVTAPTCTEAGYTTYTCTRCANSYAADIVPALGHDYDLEIIPATCEAEGAKVYTCAACGDTYSEVIDALGHDYEAVITAPTCTEEGYTTYTCTRCDASYVADETPATGHDYDVEIIPASCEADGAKVYTCTACGDTYSEVIDALGHDYQAIVTVPTCTAGGYTTYTCARCDANYVADETPATGHDYDVEIIPASCEADGAKVYTCTACGDSYSVAIPALGHDYKAVVTAPTCTAEGCTTFACTRCSGSYVDDIVPALGHDYVGVVTEPTCTAGGYTTYTCARCGDRYTSNAVPALGHDYQDVVTAPTCTEAGYTTYTCTRCADSYAADIVPALGHAYEEGTCTRCGAADPDYRPPVTTYIIDFTKTADASKFSVVNRANASITAGTGLKLVTTKDAFEPANNQLSGTAATTPKDLVLVPVSGDWTATLKFSFSTANAANGYYQFFGFYAMKDYNNAAGIRGGDGAMQDFVRKNGSVTSETMNSAPGFSTNGTYWYRLEKVGTTYTCYRSSDGVSFTRMFTLANTGIEAQNIAIDAYTGMTTGYEFTLKNLTLVGNFNVCEHTYQAVVTAPTCTAEGFTTYTCTKCGDTYTGNSVAALGHSYSDGVCIRCGAADPDYHPPVTTYTIDFTKTADASKFSVVNRANASITAGTGLKLVTTKDAFEPANDQLSGTAATTPKDLILVPVSGDWTATLKFSFSTANAANGYYQFFGFYAMKDYNNAAGIRGGDGAMQDFVRKNGSVTSETMNSAPGFSTNGTYWYRLEKVGTTYTCYRSSDGVSFTRMFTLANTGIEAQNIAIDAYTGMTTGYEFTLKNLTLVGNFNVCEHTYQAVVTAPTCTAEGFTTYTCSKCGDVYTGNSVAALGHAFVRGTCTRCGAKDPAYVPVTTYVLADTIEAGKQYVIVSGDNALTNKSANMPAVSGKTLGATTVKISGDRITSKVESNMIWTFNQGSSSVCGSYTEGFYITNDGSHILSRESSTKKGAAALSSSKYTASSVGNKDYYAYWIIRDQGNGNKSMFLYSTVSGEYVFALRGEKAGFNVTGSAQSSMDSLLSQNKVRLFEVISE